MGLCRHLPCPQHPNTHTQTYTLACAPVSVGLPPFHWIWRITNTPPVPYYSKPSSCPPLPSFHISQLPAPPERCLWLRDGISVASIGSRVRPLAMRCVIVAPSLASRASRRAMGHKFTLAVTILGLTPFRVWFAVRYLPAYLGVTLYYISAWVSAWAILKTLPLKY